MDVEADAGRPGVGPQALGTAGVADLGPGVILRVAEEELHVGRLSRLRLGDRVGLIDVGAQREGRGGGHAAIVGSRADSFVEPRSWQAVAMDMLVVGVLTLSLLLIVVAGVWIVGAALSGRRG